MIALSERQQAWGRLAIDGAQKVNLYHGPIRTSKTVGVGAAFSTWANARYRNARFLLASKTMAQVRDAVVPELMRWGNRAGVPVKLRLNEKKLIVGRNVFMLYDGFDFAAADKIRGLTFAGAWLNEASLLPEDFVNVAMDRCHMDGSKVWLDTNPDAPNHHLYVGYLEGYDKDGPLINPEAECLIMRGKFADNPSLSPGYEAGLRKRHSGLYLRRMVDGEWVAGSGLIYQLFDARTHVRQPPDTEPDEWLLAVDPGPASTTHATLAGRWGNAIYLADEYRWDVNEQFEQKPHAAHAEAIRHMCGTRLPKYIWGDPEDQRMIQALANAFPECHVANAVKYGNSVYEGIMQVDEWLCSGFVFIAPQCRHTISEIGRYYWDEKAAARGETKPRKIYDHAMDCLRYLIHSFAVARPSRLAGN